MRMILIDPHKREVSEVQMEGGNIDAYYQVMECGTFSCAGPHLFIDDEGLFKNPQAFFSFIPYHPHYPLAGKALLTGGADDNGETLPCTLSLDAVRQLVIWREPRYANKFSQAGGFDGSVGTLDEDNKPKDVTVIPFRPEFDK